MEESFILTVMMVAVLVAGIGAQVLANVIKIPSIVFLLVFGVALGPDGFGYIRPQDLGVGLEVIVALSVALILFEGGLNLNLKQLERVSNSLWRLVSLGATITLFGGAIAAHYFGEFPWTISFIYSSLVVVTGPTVINPILKRVRVSESLSSLLEGEGVLIDPIGAILAVVVLNLCLAQGTTTTVNGGEIASALAQLAGSLLLGAVLGAIGGGAIGYLLKRFRQFFSEELTNSLVLAGALGIYAVSQVLVQESGLMAAVTAGVALRQVAEIQERQVRRFQGQLVLLAISVLFILLTANLSIASIFALGWGAAATVAVLMVLVRPLSVLLCTWGGELSWREKMFAAWMAPRGIVAASVSSLFALVLTEKGVAGGEAIKALVFLTIATTVILQGLSASAVAGLLGLNEGGATVVVGNNLVSVKLAELLQKAGRPVVAIAHQQLPGGATDTSPDDLANIEVESGSVIYGNALDESILILAGIERAEQLVAITLNGEVNQAIAALASKAYELPAVIAAVAAGRRASDEVEEIVGGSGAISRWNGLLHSEQVQVKTLQLPLSLQGNRAEWTARVINRSPSAPVPLPSSSQPQTTSESLPAVSADNWSKLVESLSQFANSNFVFPIALRRKTEIILFPAQEIWRPGDELFCLEREASELAIEYKPIAPIAEGMEQSPGMGDSQLDGMAWRALPEG